MKAKIENFFYYYKYHVLAVIFALIVIFVLVKEENVQEKEIPLVIVDDSSQMNLIRAENMMQDFAREAGLSADEVAFYYRSMYLEQDKFKDISFDIAGVEEYYDYIADGRIDMIITSVDSLTQMRNQEYEVVDMTEYFTEQELKTYENNIYFADEKPVGIIFSSCDKAEEFFEDDYPTEYHYILQISKGSENDKNVRAFIEYLLNK